MYFKRVILQSFPFWNVIWTCVHWHVYPSMNASGLYSRGEEFEFRPGNRLSWSRFIVVSLSSHLLSPVKYCGRISNLGTAATFHSLFTIHFRIRFSIASDELLNHKKHIHPALVLRVFALNRPCQFTPLLNLRCHIFGLTPFGWLLSVTLTRYFSWEYLFFYWRSFSQELN